MINVSCRKKSWKNYRVESSFDEKYYPCAKKWLKNSEKYKKFRCKTLDKYKKQSHYTKTFISKVKNANIIQKTREKVVFLNQTLFIWNF